MGVDASLLHFERHRTHALHYLYGAQPDIAHCPRYESANTGNPDEVGRANGGLWSSGSYAHQDNVFEGEVTRMIQKLGAEIDWNEVHERIEGERNVASRLLTQAYGG